MPDRVFTDGPSAGLLSAEQGGRTRDLLQRLLRLRHLLLAVSVLALAVMALEYLNPAWTLGPDGSSRGATNPLTLACVAIALLASAMVRPNRKADPVETGLWFGAIAMAALFPLSSNLAILLVPGHEISETCANTAVVVLCLGCARLLASRVPPAALFAALLATVMSFAGLISFALGLDLVFRASTGATLVALLSLSLAATLAHFRKQLVWSLMTPGPSGRFLRLSALAWGTVALLMPALLTSGIVPMAAIPVVYLGVMVAWLAFVVHFHGRYARLLWLATHAQGFTLRDRLTGAYTRAAAQQAYAANPDHRDLGLVMIDLDNFKCVNDRYGHPRGDAVLVETVAALRRELRISDLLVRWGGDEFIAIVQVDAIPELMQIAERLRVAVSTVSLDPDGDARLNASVGVTLARTGGSNELDHWVAEVDAALYDAKNAGKNRVSIAPSLRADMQAATAP